MARGDVTVFEEAKAYIIDGGWEAADQIWLGLVTNSPAVVVSDAVPAYGSGGTTNYTPIATAGNYAAGGELLDTLGNMVTEAAGVMTFDDTGAFVTWAQNASNPQTAMFGIVYHYTSKLAIAMIDLAGPIDMQAGDLTITWNGSGIFTIT
jgi:hypothetical protein